MDLTTNLVAKLSDLDERINDLNDEVESVMQEFGNSVINEVYPGNTMTEEQKEDVLIGFYEWMAENHKEHCFTQLVSMLDENQPFMGLESIVLMFGMVPDAGGILRNVASGVPLFYQYLKEYLTEVGQQAVE